MPQVFSSFAEGGAAIAGPLAVGLLAAGLVALAAATLRLYALHRRGEEERANQRDLIENLHEGIYRSTLCGRQLSANRALVRLHDAGRDGAAATRAAILAGGRVLSAVREDFLLGTVRHRASASIGAVVFDGDSASTDEVLKHADIAMYQVKAAGRDGMALYDPATMGEAAGAARTGRGGRPRCRRHA